MLSLEEKTYDELIKTLLFSFFICISIKVFIEVKKYKCIQVRIKRREG